MAYLAAAAFRPTARRALAPRKMSQIEMDVSDALNRMIFAIGDGDLARYKQIVNIEFPTKLGPRIEQGYRPLLQDYVHRRDGSDFQDMTPLQAAVFSGSPEMVEEVLKLGNDLEYSTPGVIHEIIENKTARGMADLFIAKSTTPEQAAPYRAIKKLLLLRGAKPKMVTTIMGKKLAFPENKVNINEYKRGVEMMNRMFGKSQTRKGRKTRKARKTRKNTSK